MSMAYGEKASKGVVNDLRNGKDIINAAGHAADNLKNMKAMEHVEIVADAAVTVAGAKYAKYAVNMSKGVVPVEGQVSGILNKAGQFVAKHKNTALKVETTVAETTMNYWAHGTINAINGNTEQTDLEIFGSEIKNQVESKAESTIAKTVFNGLKSGVKSAIKHAT